MTHNNFGKKFLTDQCQKIKISDLMRSAKRQAREQVLGGELETEGGRLGLSETKTGNGGLRYWFICPQCAKKVGILYKHPISQILGCRRCLNLDYRSHRYRGMVEGVV